MIELPRVKLLVTDSTRSTVTGPESAVPRFSTTMVGLIVSPACIREGTASPIARSSGNAWLVELNRDRLAQVVGAGDLLERAGRVGHEPDVKLAARSREPLGTGRERELRH